MTIVEHALMPAAQYAHRKLRVKVEAIFPIYVIKINACKTILSANDYHRALSNWFAVA